MHCSFAVAALLVSAVVAKPINKLQQKRAVVYETEYAVVVETVYVTAGAAAPATTEAPATTTPHVTVATDVVQQQPAQWTNTWTHSWYSEPSTTSTHKKSPKHTTQKSTTVAPVKTSTTATPPPPVTTVEPTTTAPATTVVPTTTTTEVSTPTATVASSYEDIVILHHNMHRANHSAPDLTWSDELASIALETAQLCNYQHNTDVGNYAGGYGQNMAIGAPADRISYVITDMMYNGEMPYYADYYGDVNPDFDNFRFYGHFTQIVWKGTTQVGCATVTCPSVQNNPMPSEISNDLTFCNYGPAGNMGGEYADNIGRPLGQPTITGDYGLSS